MTEILYAHDNLIRSFYDALTTVAHERIYLEMTDTPDFSRVREFQQKLIHNQWPCLYAVERGVVVGWADIVPIENPRLRHRGQLGMGLIPSHRGQGLGSKLLSAAIAQANKSGLEKIELNVYDTNTVAIRLYEKAGFTREGYIKNYRKLDNQYFSCISMAKFLAPGEPL